ncbi:LuxR C-terminal-related transcriptional regulator [Rhodococcus jostii]|uniref:LuxR C-terminal-related transcriptional regulator n=1 Tax=Rhodococcus jostii TaxID=132919 RepID=UPI0036695132
MSTAITRGDRFRVGGVLQAVKALGPVEVAFAASVDPTNKTFVLDRFNGARTDRLRGIVSPLREGLGGRCISLGRPVFVMNYATAKGITHRYDQEVAGEGLSAVFAIPLESGGVVHAIVYGAVRRPLFFGERLIDQAVDIVKHSGHEVSAFKTVVESLSADDTSKARTALEVGAEIMTIAAAVADPALKRRLYELGGRLSDLPDRRVQSEPVVKLSPRELDVLAAVALGDGNVEVSRRLGLTLHTTKSYLKSAMSKLDSHTRGEAVHRARAAGLLP